MNRTVGRCIICNRLFQATDKNRGVLNVNGWSYPCEVCDYHMDVIGHEIKLAKAMVEAQGKP